MRYTMMRCPWCGLRLARQRATEKTNSVEFQESADCKHCGYHYEAAFDPASGQIVTKITPGRGDRQYGVDNPTLGPPEDISPDEYGGFHRKLSEAEIKEQLEAIEEYDDEWWQNAAREADEERWWKAVEEADRERERWNNCPWDD